MSIYMDRESAEECWGSECYPIGFNDGYECWDWGIRPRDPRAFAKRRAYRAGVRWEWIEPYARAFMDGYEFAQHPDYEDELA